LYFFEFLFEIVEMDFVKKINEVDGANLDVVVE